MLSINKVKRILKQCEHVDSAFRDIIPADLQVAWARNEGWMQALRLVLEQDTYPIREDSPDD